jgi:hypothetical protein
MAIDLKVLGSVVANVLDGASQRLPINLLAEEVIKRVKGSDLDSVRSFLDLDTDAREILVRAVVLASDNYDIRAGRTGGAGKKEWFKGGGHASEPTGAAAKIAKRLREEHGLDKADAVRVANAYLECLADGELDGPLADAAMIKRFK